MAPAATLLQATGPEATKVAAGYYSTRWFALALIDAGLAQLHGRRGLNWFLLSILLGPIATLSLVLQSKKP